MLPRIRVQRITTRIQIVYNRIGDVMVSVLASSDVMVSGLASSDVMVSVLASSADLIVIIITHSNIHDNPINGQQSCYSALSDDQIDPPDSPQCASTSLPQTKQ
jgi:hypothetical protein